MADPTTARAPRRSLGKTILQYKYFYLMVLPILVWYALFSYGPMYGVTLAFKTFNYGKGILGSPWTGLDNFKTLLTDPEFRTAFFNTLIISVMKLIVHFPMPIILAIVLYEFSRNKARRFFQTILTFPHFISWVVLAGIIMNILSKDGIYNQIAMLFGADPSSPLADERAFRPILYITHVWREIGWDSIIYLAALAGINPELFEAAEVDGASRFRRLLNIAWPGIKSTVSVLLILHVGQMLTQGASFEQIFNLYSSPVYSVADTIDTYIYRTSFTVGGDFGYMTAVGVVKSVISLVLLWAANTFAKRMGEQGLY
ncbi:putative aldouronate transport system permease protein [Cohnella sp. OV330]|uniref:ABC transporter permease n=1 Tax=Cohnella sp. OV330 TaxID=1855288 RepID=UPI0008F19B36|nr:ABC transporter permease subunit [Cohnella sp. OV330]SFB06826.1 putative aldouronate transport system permease protein [Cohnella sp. OV330]